MKVYELPNCESRRHGDDIGHYKRALHWLETEELDAAVAEFGAAIALEGEVAWYHHSLGEVLERQGNMAGARAAYARAMTLNPMSSKYRQAMARVGVRQASDVGSLAGEQQSAGDVRPRLLVVEDSEVTRTWYDRILRRRYNLSFAATARAALRAMPAVRPALVLLDWQLAVDIARPSRLSDGHCDIADEVGANSSGLEVCKQIKRSAYRHTPVLMLTGKKSLIDMTLGKMAHADRYLTKPVTAEALLAVIQELLSLPGVAAQGDSSRR